MSTFWGGVLIGVVAGLNIGVLVIGLLVGAKCGECGARMQRWLEEKAE
jgi:hypothetical protein